MKQLLIIAAVVLWTVTTTSAAKVEVVNNQPFALQFPWKLRDGRTVLVDVPRSGKQTVDPNVINLGAPVVSVEAVENGVRLKGPGRDFGSLQWDVFVDKLKKRPTDKEAAETKRDFDALFQPMAMKFAVSGRDSQFETWSAEAEKAGLKLSVALDVYPHGYAELRTTVTNLSAPKELVYAAVLTRWQQPAGSTNKAGYDNRIIDLSAGGATPFRQGEGRHHFIQRGADWFNTTLPGDGRSIAWLNDFAPQMTLHHAKRRKTAAHWSGANTAQIAQEGIVAKDKLYSIAEIARPNIKMYDSRVTGSVLPDKDQPQRWSSLLIFANEKLDDARVDQIFVGYSSFNQETKDGNATKLTFGVPYCKFGTAYFPFSTLGENFEKWHMPGMSKETYWPLAADVVKNYKLFADDIKRDLRIAKAMGFESIRQHHLELIDTLERKTQDEYLDFFFAELKHLGLTTLLDVKLPPERVVELVKKYRPLIDGVEIDNEVLLMNGVIDEDVPTWIATYKAVKEVAPEIPVWLTGHTNTGAFKRLRTLGVPFDKVGCHAYMDSLDAIPSGRNYALAVADYASEIGKEPVITEWNWRFLTRMTPEARAKVYPPIFENVLATRCMPVFYQFQFNESLAMTTRSLRGIRHYEPLNLSRRPRPEAFELMKLMQKYGNPASPQNALRTECDVDDVNVTNTSKRRLSVKATIEAAPGASYILDRDAFDIEPGQTQKLKMRPRFPNDAQPGFYHSFVRLDAGDFVSYAWRIDRAEGPLKIDKGKSPYHPEVKYLNNALDYDFNRDIAIVYPAGRDNESRWDVESAWLIYQTLEAATGRPVKIFKKDDLPKDLIKTGNLIFIDMPTWSGTTKPAQPVSTTQLAPSAPKKATQATGDSWVTRLPPTSDHGDWLIVGGDDEQSLNVAAIDLVLRYWKHARDSGMRRIPLTDKPIDKGMDPSLLP